MVDLLRGLRTEITREKVQILGLLIAGVFLFVCSLQGVGRGFKLVFSEWANLFLSMIESGVAPFTGLAIGVLATTILVSSSAVIATTMVSMASMVAAGLSLSSAMRFGVPMVLGANLGTTVSNTVTLFAIRRATTQEEFNATIPAVIVDDIFKFLTVIIFFTLEVTTGFLSTITTALGAFIYELLRLEQIFAIFEKSVIDILIEEPIIKPLERIFSTWFGAQLGGLFFFILWFALVVVSIDLLITKGLNKLIETDWADRLSAALDSPFKSFTTGFFITWLVGSSSVGTSLIIPMVATKIVNLKKAYPYICGCALGTTLDLAQIYGYMAGGVVSIMLGLTHVLFNVFGLTLWLVSPLRIVPPRIANAAGRFIASSPHSTLLLIAYAIGTFVLLPLMVILIF